MNFAQSKGIWLILGPIIALLVYWGLPDQYLSSTGEQVIFTHPAKATLALLTWMAIWWLTEATHITVTAMLPIALFPLFDVATIKEATAPYASHIIFLFLGGFIIAVAIQRWHLDKRIALGILTRIGNSPSRIVGGFMLATALLSAFISNTATTAMMLPIGLSVIALLSDNESDKNLRNSAFATCIMLCIAYAANIGTSVAVVAVLDVSSVKNTTAVIIINKMSNGGMIERTVACAPINSVTPLALTAEARLNPPPNNIRIPQGRSRKLLHCKIWPLLLDFAGIRNKVMAANIAMLESVNPAKGV